VNQPTQPSAYGISEWRAYITVVVYTHAQHKMTQEIHKMLTEEIKLINEMRRENNKGDNHGTNVT
jgi:hypothetical protein